MGHYKTILFIVLTPVDNHILQIVIRESLATPPNQLVSNNRVYLDIQPYYDMPHLFSFISHIDDMTCPMVIKRWYSNRHENSFKISKHAVVVYFLRGLDIIVHHNDSGRNITFDVYEDHTPFNKWLEDPKNVIRGDLYTKKFLQILR